MSTHDALERFRPEDPSFIADPYPAYDELRAQGPIHYNARTGHWLVTRRADVNALLRDRRFGRTHLNVATHADMGRAEEPAGEAPFWHLIRNGMLDREPPDHRGSARWCRRRSHRGESRKCAPASRRSWTG